jgi:hypothetical protein
MSFLTPLGLLLGLLALPVLALYMLRLRRKDALVSSTLLWHALLRDRQANTPWQKLRRNLLLLLQLLILAVLVLAFARPAVPIPSVASGSLVLLLDASASMSATDEDPTRFEAARQTASRLITDLAASANLSVILVDAQPRLLASASGAVPSERQAAQLALQQAQTSSGAADWTTAFSLAAAVASAHPSTQETTFVILSDGGLPTSDLTPLPGPVRYVLVGNTQNNLAIAAFSLRQVAPPALKPELFASVANYSSMPREVVLSIYFNDQLLTAQQLSLPADGRASLSLDDLPASAGIYRASLSSGSESQDDLALDDTAYAVYAPGGQRRVLVASQEYFQQPPGMNILLEQILASLPGVTSYRVSPQAQVDPDQGFSLPDSGTDPFDLYVFDGVLPSGALPAGNLLLINPPANDLFTVQGLITPTLPIQARDHALMQYVGWDNIYIARAQHMLLPTWGETLVSSPEGPLVFVGQTAGRRVAVLAFDLNDSDLPLKISFPLLFASLLDYLVPPQAFEAPDGLLPAAALSILPAPDVTQVAVVSPSGAVTRLLPADGGVLFTQSQELGVYTVNYLRPTDDPQVLPEADYFAVNLFDAGESDIAPAANIQVGRSSVLPADRQALSLREFWPWLAALALALLLLEWWLYHGRQRYPGASAPPEGGASRRHALPALLRRTPLQSQRGTLGESSNAERGNERMEVS